MCELQVEKRDGKIVPFVQTRIETAVTKAALATGATEADAASLATETAGSVTRQLTTDRGHEPVHLEEIQDAVEKSLMACGAHEVAKQYILYRQKRATMRQTHRATDDDIRAFQENTAYFSTDLELFQHLNKYSRFDAEKGRRETWPETARRAIDFMKWHLKERLDKELEESIWHRLEQAILMREALPSMRLLQMAGPAAQRCNVSVYNCAYTTIAKIQDFAEILYILMQGTGQSFSVEYDFVEELPKVKKQRKAEMPRTHAVLDSTEGWCYALTDGLTHWFEGKDLLFDYSLIRAAGAPLKTKGGRASGPGPLKELLDFAREVVLSRQGRHLRPIDAHDIACKIGKIVQVGGVRRAAELSLSNLDDLEMREAKFGEFWNHHPQRNMANNSVAYNEKPSATEFMEEWLSLAKSGAGERGVFNRQGAVKSMPKRRLERLKEVFGSAAKRLLEALGINPCGEIRLLSKQFCNLSLGVIRPADSWADVRRKVELATIFGTIQSTMTFFNFIGKEWKANCEAEHLLGVDIPGASDHPLLGPGCPDQAKNLEELRQLAVETNQTWSADQGIAPSTAVTCSKPGGNSSVFLGVGHTVTGWNARYIKRHVRVNSIDPMAQFLIDAGVPHWPEYDDPSPEDPNVWVFAFPLEAPETAFLNDQTSALEMLEHWLTFKKHWTEHNPSITIYIRPEEWIAVGNWVYEHWDEVGGLAFLPKDDHIYPLAPITPLSQEEYAAFVADFPKIPWEKFPRYERAGSYVPDISREYQCTGDACMLV